MQLKANFERSHSPQVTICKLRNTWVVTSINNWCQSLYLHNFCKRWMTSVSYYFTITHYQTRCIVSNTSNLKSTTHITMTLLLDDFHLLLLHYYTLPGQMQPVNTIISTLHTQPYYINTIHSTIVYQHNKLNTIHTTILYQHYTYNAIYSTLLYQNHQIKNTSAVCPSAVNIRVTVISFFVSVPVLSEHITSTHPA